MRHEPGAMALCIDPWLPKQMVTLVRDGSWLFTERAWFVEFPAPVYGWAGGKASDQGYVAQRFLILLPDADPVETETEREVVA